MTVRNLILGSMLTAAAIAVPAGAQARTVEFEVDVAPPAPRVEVVPAPRAGYVYEPGYWRMTASNTHGTKATSSLNATAAATCRTSWSDAASIGCSALATGMTKTDARS